MNSNTLNRISIAHLIVVYFFLSTTIVVFGKSIYILLFFLSIAITIAVIARENHQSRDLLLTTFIITCAGILGILFGSNPIGLGITIVSLLALSVAPKRLIVQAFHQVKLVFALLLIPGICIWLIHVITGNFEILNLGYLPDSYISDLKREGGVRYVFYPLSIRTIHPVLVDFLPSVYRFQSIFDEPGYLGTLAAFVLAAQGRFKFNPSNIVILIAGIISLSLAFYILFVLYILFTYVRSLHGILFSFALLAVIMYVAYLFIPGFDILISNRLQMSGNGLSGNNRNSDYINDVFQRWLSGSSVTDFLFGMDYIYDGSTSAKMIAIRSGIVGVILSVTFYVILILKYFSKPLVSRQVVFILIYFISFIQRPSIFDMAFLFIFIYVLSSSSRRGQPRQLT